MNIPLTVYSLGKTVDSTALIDSGADDQFIDFKFVVRNKIPVHKLQKPLNVYNVDGTPNLLGQITHSANLSFSIAGMPFYERFLITTIGEEAMILGLPWLRRHNPQINWITGLISLPEN